MYSGGTRSQFQDTWTLFDVCVECVLSVWVACDLCDLFDFDDIREKGNKSHTNIQMLQITWAILSDSCVSCGLYALCACVYIINQWRAIANRCHRRRRHRRRHRFSHQIIIINISYRILPPSEVSGSVHGVASWLCLLCFRIRNVSKEWAIRKSNHHVDKSNIVHRPVWTIIKEKTRWNECVFSSAPQLRTKRNNDSPYDDA